MPLEQSPTYIASLEPAWPLGTDPQKDGDDHLRMIKQVLKNTFPNYTAPIFGGSDQLNDVLQHVSYTDTDEDAGWTRARAQFNTTDNTAYLPLLVGDVPAAEMTAHANAVAISWGQVQNLLYPVGHCIVTADGRNPVDYLGFGTWVQRSGAIYGAGAVTDLNGEPGNHVPGVLAGRYKVYAEEISPFDVQLSIDQNGAHGHGLKSWYGASGFETNGSDSVPTGNGNADYNLISNTDGNHGHTGTARIGLGTLQHFQPGYVLYVWERTA